MKTIEMIVPCFNESDVLDMFYKEVTPVMQSLDGFDYSFIFVNDGSRDNTLDIIKSFAEKDSHVKYISFSRNFGKEAAMLSGLRYSSAEYVGILDADLQHSPELIPEMVDALINEDYDVAAAKRSDRKGENGFKSFLSESFYKVANKMTEVEIDNGAQDYRIMKRKVVDAITSLTEYNRFTKGIFSWVGFKTKWFEHENRERAAGTTKWNIVKLLKYALDGILGFSNAPLRLPFYLGMLMTGIGVIYALVFLIIHYGFNPSFSGIHIVLAAVLAVGGLVLVCMGIVGEYMARIYNEIKGRPVFIVDETNIEKK
ncbi:MAG: glycosyltransferase family 2 protein [Faecalibacterium sp.]|nr:glycosyltransferase family 2 protein [Ruminococcus sp.]MCM1393032.1 glycosyltransferase family 2 protein [Ruminococcus sp.]MCM1486565.1 glycosyltransferase family 2 protein [Faecalibacterium sp.]